MKQQNHEHWGSRLGVVLAVSGSAIGLGNFIRFPGQAAMNGGGAFMLPYLVSLLIVAIPLASAEWALGRYGGRMGFHSPMGIYYAAGKRNPVCGVAGGLMTFTAFVIDMYYLFIESWCLVYALQYLGGLLKPLGLGFSLFPQLAQGMSLESSQEYGAAFNAVTGVGSDGALFSSAGASTLVVLGLCVLVNFYLIYRGVSKGIERFCKAVAPLILLCSLLILVRVFTLKNPTGAEGQSLLDGLGFMWNPGDLGKVLSNPGVWLAATSQIFFSTSICTSAVVTYTSYVRPKEDVALSSLSATMANEFCEVCLGGLMIVPPAIMFLGKGIADQIGSSFSLGFIVLPNVFGKMPAGNFFGFVFFSLLFFSAITSSISQLQPSVAFIKEAFHWSHKTCVFLAAIAIVIGVSFVCWFTGDLVALDAFDFWSANFTPFLCAIVQTGLIVYIWGKDSLRDELDRGALVKLPRWFPALLQRVSLPYLILIFGLWLWRNSSERVVQIESSRSAQISTAFLAVVGAVLLGISIYAVRRWKKEEKRGVDKKTDNQ